MSTDLVPTNVQLPSYLASSVGASSIGSAMTSGAGGFKRISIRGGRFRIKDGKNETVLPNLEFRAVIVGASPNMTKTFFKGKYNPNDDDKGPDCYSNDGIRPAADAEDPQAQLCATCPNNAWGSKMSDTGQQMKACSDQKRLAIISASDNSEDPEVYLFTVTPAALNGFRTYGKLLESKGLPPEICVTKISFDENASFPKVVFSWGGFISEDMKATVDKLVGSTAVLEITGETPIVAHITDSPKPSPITVKAPEPDIQDAEFEDIPVQTILEVKPAPVVEAKPVIPVVQSSDLADDIKDILAKMKEE